jgi:hypothetical protein
MKIKKTIQGSIPSNKVYNSYNDNKHNVYSTEYLNDKLVHVGMQSPDSQEEVWIKTGKNLFRDKMVRNTYNATFRNGTVNQVEADSKTPLQWKVQKYYDDNYLGGLSEVSTYNEVGRIAFSFQKTSEFNAVRFGMNGTSIDTLISFDASGLINNKTYTLSFNIIDITQGYVAWNNIQLEAGDKATPYEAYEDKKIYTRRDNGLYEEMINVSAVNDLIPQTIYPSFNWDYIYSTDLQYTCCKIGKMVFLNIYTMGFHVSPENGTTIISNLPPTANNAYIGFYFEGGIGDGAYSCRCLVTPGGTIQIHWGSPTQIGDSANKQYRCYLMYETNK